MQPDVSPYFALYLPRPKTTLPMEQDYSSGFPYYSTPQRTTTMNYAKRPSWPLAVPEFSMGSPTFSHFSSDTSETGSSPGACVDRHVDVDQLPLQTKDPKLQAYFFRMEKTLRTCHPNALHAETANLTRDIVANPTDIESSIRTVAEALAKAGCRKVEYSKSCAVIANKIFHQLRSTSHDAGASFAECLIGAVMKTFDGYYLKVTAYASGLCFFRLIIG